MSHTPHELAAEFPEQVDLLHKLRESDACFARFGDEHHGINRAVRRAKTDIDPTDDLHMVEMRKQLMQLKDELWALLQGASV